MGWGVGSPVHKALLTKVTSGSSISSEHTHVTPINIVNGKGNIPGLQRWGVGAGMEGAEEKGL